ncbi:hypothetical protein CISIN_1g0024292mg, partial [Citrus sinensis]
AKGPIAFASFILVGLSIIMVSSGIIPPFSEETARAVNIHFRASTFQFITR